MLLNRSRAYEQMERHGLDALVAATPENVYYLSGSGTEHSFHFAIQGLTAAILPRDDTLPASLIVQGMDLPDQVLHPTWMPDLRLQESFGTRPDVRAEQHLSNADRELLTLISERGTGEANRQRLIGKVLTDLGLTTGTIGFDDVRVMADLKRNELASTEVVDALNVFRSIRVVKTSAEIALLRHATRIVQHALEGMGALCVEGTTTREILHYFRTVMSMQGGYGSHGTGSAGTGYHNFDHDRRFQSGDVVLLDPAGHYRHYWADLGRVAIVGDAPDGFDEKYADLMACHEAIVPLLREGVSTAQVRECAYEVVDKRGNLTRGGGLSPMLHSIGIDQYDHPQTLGSFLGDDFMLERNMVMNFETVYMEVGGAMLQLEDTYLIGASEPQKLDTLSPGAIRPALCGDI